MRSVFCLALALLPLPVFAGGSAGFDDEETGSPPAGWAVTMTGTGSPQWTVERDPTAPSPPNSLKQSGTATYPICVKNDTELRDGFVEVSFMPLSGKEDQAAGIVWRYRDPDNYYIVRANALENNVVLYKVENGKRTALDIVGRSGGYGVDADVLNGQWQILRIEFSADRFTVFLNGIELFQVTDATFPEAGLVGIWTKADSVTLFDDFRFGPIER